LTANPKAHRPLLEGTEFLTVASLLFDLGLLNTYSLVTWILQAGCCAKIASHLPAQCVLRITLILSLFASCDREEQKAVPVMFIIIDDDDDDDVCVRLCRQRHQEESMKCTVSSDAGTATDRSSSDDHHAPQSSTSRDTVPGNEHY